MDASQSPLAVPKTYQNFQEWALDGGQQSLSTSTWDYGVQALWNEWLPSGDLNKAVSRKATHLYLFLHKDQNHLKSISA